MKKISVYDLKGKEVAKILLPKEIFGEKVNEKLISQAVRVFLANQRQGTRKVKTRGEVVGSRRKIWRQKGTGRARHGDRYAPIFVGGGIAHGPRQKDYSLRLNKKARKRALFSALSAKLNEDKIKVVKGISSLGNKTKEMVEFLENLKLLGKNKKLDEKVLMVLTKREENIIRAGGNIGKLKMMEAEMINCYEVLKREWLVLDKEAVKVLKERFLSEKKKGK